MDLCSDGGEDEEKSVADVRVAKGRNVKSNRSQSSVTEGDGK